MNAQKAPGRQRGASNIKPTAKEIAGYYQLLKGAAQQGDTLAASELIKIDLLSQRKENIQCQN
ncbi:MAG: hypothetical protein ACTJG4_03045 [Vreelandella alkaliphila]|uniref:Uncharacterized protein n=1 Tax=Halomonas campaniensis TaxID=213554 RepID=A0A3D0KJ05_9GAMM|nr:MULTISPECIES: hypothetical protein [unclassified Halomonas]HBP41914.1 hypothetical protein [Halomonas sp.]HBS82361.1 hypothetical protein [Halomonas campaniensis]HCA03270.1 hypothetical protein [Halomonas campaniensis]